MGREVRRERPERQRARPALHAPVAERPARHGLAGGVHDEPGEVDPARRLGRAQIDVLAQLGVSTVLLGGIYALIAVGLTLIFGIMRVVNFAHGEFLMLGMYVAFWAYSLWTLDPYFVLFVSIPLFFGIGYLTYVLVMRGVIHASHNVQIFTTVGLSTALQNVALVLWTGDFRTVRPWHSSVVIRVFGTAFNLSQVVAFAIALGLTLVLFAFMKWTHTGRVMRATAQDHDAATLMGVDTDKVYRLTFAIGIACVGAAGALVSPLYAVYPTAGLQFVLLAYVVVVLGGLGDMVGAMLGSLIVAAVEVVGSYFFGVAWKEVCYFILFIAVLVFRPAGLFGQRGAETLGV
ncbi:MAG: branched-chain amino acid ABC transporter permease [Candidatus Rokuibacteriota bacterium]|nr:MAG: branched-chain amino acid ABC transporter permease [Candidatus Rokubacteria bacterium]